MNGLHPDNRPIGVFDSGIGGLTVANAIFRTLPSESLIYFGDTARVPYGPRPPETIQRFSIEISRFLMDQGAKVIVVACNTASASALSVLRETWPGFPFVGMEPAVKPAAKATRTGVIGVLATEGTFKSQRYAGLMDRYAAGIRVFEDPCLGLVPLIESGKWEAPETEALITSIIRPMLAGGADTLVLGCTHYPLILPLIRRVAGPEVQIIDPAPAVARQVARVLENESLAAAPDNRPSRRFFASGNDASLRLTLDHLTGAAPPVSKHPMYEAG
ncbi:MAG: glutamate racemase [Lewinellaceae bacterium]|nr:glutamate racemase [Lewinella sp.]MCB9282054.1 glutamate racemase [Lewinellaceae bacterium]